MPIGINRKKSCVFRLLTVIQTPRNIEYSVVLTMPNSQYRFSAISS